MTTAAQQRVIEWLANGKTGVSSKTMAFYLGFDVRPDDCGHPHDPADFNRCLQLLELVPEMRPHLPRMAEISPYWARLVARWDDVEKCFRDEAGLGWTKAQEAYATYKLMKEVLHGG